MKYIFRSKETWELLHSWRTGSLEVTAAFFFYYRGNAIQKSFEGVLRSLIIQILSPHRIAYQERYRPTWERYESVKKKERRAAMNHKLREGQLSNIREQIERLRGHLRRYQDPQSEFLLSQFDQREQELKSQLDRIEQERQQSVDAIVSIAADFEQHSANPTTMLLRAIVSDVSEVGHRSISKLERVLRRLVEQEVVETDLVLFFDALDEFDGNLDLISRFLKDLIRPQTKSMTRVKVLFSSRPWKQLKEHFSEYPGFALQEHTKSDIERYAAGKAANAGAYGHSLAQVLPFVIAKADGVFVWVRFALNVLIEQVASHRGQISADALKEKILTLPADLFEFYELIIERISKSSRRHTYALLELLIRHNGPPLTTVQVRDAVLVSGCHTYEEARCVLEATSRHPLSGAKSYLERVNSEIYSWGGGLVEIKKHSPREATENNIVYRPQLMHQTVLEFATGLSFKKTVVGDLTSIISENGHSFHLKYWSTKTRWAINNKHSTISMLQNRFQRPSVIPSARALQGGLSMKNREILGYLNYHAKQSELTTGRSQFEFLYSMPLLIDEDEDEDTQPNSPRRPGHGSEFLFLIASCGLSLCLRDWITSKPGELERVMIPINTDVIDKASIAMSYPLLSSLVFAPPQGTYHAGNLTTIKLLLENGYKLKREPQFFRWLMKETWCGKFEGNPDLIPDESLHKIIRLALDHGANPRDCVRGIDIPDTNVPLIHIAPPQLIEDLIRYGAKPNTVDDRQRTPLDWVIRPPHDISFKPRDWDLKRRYATCNLLLRHGGTCSQGETKLTLREVTDMLETFKGEGYDVEFLTARLTEMTAPEGLREYETWAQSGEDETLAEEQPESGLVYDGLEDGPDIAAAQGRWRVHMIRTPLQGTLSRRALGDKLGEIPSLLWKHAPKDCKVEWNRVSTVRPTRQFKHPAGQGERDRDGVR
jgi:ribosomal protein S15P/S13E